MLTAKRVFCDCEGIQKEGTAFQISYLPKET